MKFENRGKWLQEAEDKLAAYDTQEHPDFLDGDDKVLTMEDGDDEELMNFEEDELDIVEEDDTLDSPEEEEDAIAMSESMPPMSQRKRIEFEDDIVRVYDGNKEIYAGAEDYEPMQDEDWKWDNANKYYKFDKYIKVCCESSQKNEVWTDIYGILGDIGEKRYFNKQKELSRADMEKEFRKALKIKGLKPAEHDIEVALNKYYEESSQKNEADLSAYKQILNGAKLILQQKGFKEDKSLAGKDGIFFIKGDKAVTINYFDANDDVQVMGYNIKEQEDTYINDFKLNKISKLNIEDSVKSAIKSLNESSQKNETFGPDDIVSIAKQKDFKKQYLQGKDKRKVNTNSFYFDNIYVVDDTTGSNIPGAKLGMKYKDLASALDKFFGESAQKNENALSWYKKFYKDLKEFKKDMQKSYPGDKRDLSDKIDDMLSVIEMMWDGEKFESSQKNENEIQCYRNFVDIADKLKKKFGQQVSDEQLKQAYKKAYPNDAGRAEALLHMYHRSTNESFQKNEAIGDSNWDEAVRQIAGGINKMLPSLTAAKFAYDEIEDLQAIDKSEYMSCFNNLIDYFNKEALLMKHIANIDVDANDYNKWFKPLAQFVKNRKIG